MAQLAVSDIMDIPRLQAWLDLLYRDLALPLAIVSCQGDVLCQAGGQAICPRFPVCAGAAQREISESLSDTMDNQTYHVVDCPCGLVQVQFPIVVANEPVACVHVGQVSIHPKTGKSEADVRSSAAPFCDDPSACVKTFREVPVLSEAQLRHALPAVSRFVEMVDDVALRRLRELEALEALRTREARYERVVRSMLGMLYDYVLYPDGRSRFLYVSPQSEDIFELAPEDMERDSTLFWRMIHPDDLGMLRDTDISANRAGTVFNAEFRIVVPSGRTKWVQVRSYPNPALPGEPAVWTGFVLDVTERKEVEAALRASEQRWQFALEGAGDGVWDWNAQTNEVYYSKQWKAMLGFEDDELGGSLREWDSRIHPEDRETVFARINPLLQGETATYMSEHRLACKDGTYKWILDRGKVVSWTEQGKPLRVIGTHTDISERVHMQAQLVQSQKMESIGRLAGGIAHDFNNLLGVILGNCELALESQVLDPSIREAIHEISAAGDRAKDLTRQLLAFSSKQVLSMKMVDVNVIVANIERMIRRLLGEDIRIHVNFAHRALFVKADPSQLDQVLVNLCVNARDAMPNGGALTIETGLETVNEQTVRRYAVLQPGQYVTLTVSDTGAGMDEAILAHIFDPFFTTKELGKGTGLGLATVFGIVRQHGGTIDVLSVPGKGSTFRVYLPNVTSGEVSARQEQNNLTHPGRGERILVLEDEPALRQMLLRMLSRLGYEAIEARSVDECLEIAQNSPRIDLLLLDVVMPVLNGREVFERISVMRPETKALFMSGYTEEVIAHHGVLEEGIHFVHKPFSEAQLSQKIREALGET